MKIFSISKILMVAGALWIIIFSILAASKVNDSTLFGWKSSGFGLILIGFFYILIPFSIKPGMWSRIWAIVIAFFSILIVVGFFVGAGTNYGDVWTYLNPLPHILIALGATLWIIQG